MGAREGAWVAWAGKALLGKCLKWWILTSRFGSVQQRGLGMAQIGNPLTPPMLH